MIQPGLETAAFSFLILFRGKRQIPGFSSKGALCVRCMAKISLVRSPGSITERKFVRVENSSGGPRCTAR